MKVLLVCVSLFVFANAKKNHGAHVAHTARDRGGAHIARDHGNNAGGHTNVADGAADHASSAQSNNDFHECFLTLLRQFDFSASSDKAKSQLETLCPNDAEAIENAIKKPKYKKFAKSAAKAYDSLTADEKTQLKTNQTNGDTRGIVDFFRYKFATVKNGEKLFNNTLDAVFKPYVTAQLEVVDGILHFLKDEMKQLKKTLKTDLTAAVNTIQSKLTATPNVSADDQAKVQAFIAVLNSI